MECGTSGRALGRSWGSRGLQLLGASKRKGRLVEQIVAHLHNVPGVHVATRVMLTPRGGEGRKREIDILLTSEVACYAVRIAFECKNEGRPIDAPFIDAFVGKLEYVGIPPQHGVFVSATRYTIGAQQRARAAGVKLLTLTGLTGDRLAAAVFEAYQSVVFLFLRVKSVSLDNTVAETPELWAALEDETGTLRGTIFDPVWIAWVSGRLPASVGQHAVTVPVPDGWGQTIDGRFVLILGLAAEVQVTGLVLTYRGQFTHHSLVDAEDSSVDRWRLDARFDTADLPVEFNQVFTEEELAAHVSSLSGLRLVTGRFLLPRIDVFTRFGYMFWPPSESSATKMEQAARAFQESGDVDPMMFGGRPIDSRTMDGIFEPIWSAYEVKWHEHDDPPKAT